MQRQREPIGERNGGSQVGVVSVLGIADAESLLADAVGELEGDPFPADQAVELIGIRLDETGRVAAEVLIAQIPKVVVPIPAEAAFVAEIEVRL